ncbi:MAG: hypothetical protein Q9170_003243 [Blastenia crenularia]
MFPPTPPTVGNPLRILVLTTSSSTPLPELLQGSELPLQTPYYTATLPVWHENTSTSVPSLEAWEDEWLAAEAGEVVQIIRNVLSTIHRVLSHHRETSNKYATVDNEPLLLLVGTPQPLRPLLITTIDEWEGLCLDCGGWEWIDSEAKGKNEFGEKVGLERLRETLEANEWDGGSLDVEDDVNGFEIELGLRNDREECLIAKRMDVNIDPLDIHEAILRQDEDAEVEDPGRDIQVEELESMMLKMQAIKEKGAGMAEEERKRFAAKAIMEVMKSVESVN